MLGKLMKYEFKATGRIFLPLFGVLIIVAGFNRLFIALDFTVPKIIASTLSGFMIGAVFVIAIILTIQRFSRNLLSSEGYLMFTLPVKTDSLVWSKLLVASIWTVASMLVVVLAVFIMAVTGVDFQNVMRSLGDFFNALFQTGFTGILTAVECVVLAVGFLFSGILMLYACIALSLFVNKRRMGFAFLMYIAISVIGQALLGILSVSFDFTQLCALLEAMSGFSQIQAVLGSGFLYVLITGGVFYVVTRLMLKYKLNLE